MVSSEIISATEVREVFYCVEVYAVSADLRTVGFLWRRLVQHVSLLQDDDEAESLVCIREVVDDVL